MLQEISAGGVVVFSNTILLLKKFNGDWVLPKGRIEKSEKIGDTALREVFEEGGVKAQILKYIGKVSYKFSNVREDEIIYKTVHWYLMTTKSMECVPQKSEGFAEAAFVYMGRVPDIIKYEDERNIVLKAISLINI
ncbi:NUDIX hydrolase [Sporanaerobacter sp. PP17-6a]|jgi:8-oxo-dGTP pyrophosphatase MutT (NUDIX family)|uniref:NUDIX hydrolase n=1 Tax=Sporanaerobacter sp. PP17-6a TaxID=1891289 RepID=UPI0008A083DE|nr:NUDIX hydrolase [Sporanaerobacter sp. PP17-6a]MBE6081445.1 NUDIX hydrolase [Tissierellaceae bacterium]SCL90910.1 putative mutator protein MutT4 [Sporanaerobacter sp. PP17-6a]